ncbi:Oidioi.mRNA.OKI2018_I69.chr1.g543.t1.cds [Oikopleura dioica]|uniref:Oidioi.mRNA.OKI2018_I69.chr1.g543.t1.cds n=1 Tax=Oikopleura dioica TaxID=34765 RepID=A0ABN7SQD0_OIKDI|nr:Oidioi.mRNA.OKI2018_I69.chr1.g543.t1.cds [Oikopleura dioica]
MILAQNFSITISPNGSVLVDPEIEIDSTKCIICIGAQKKYLQPQLIEDALRNILLLDLEISPLGFALAWIPLSDFIKMFKNGVGPHSITLEHQESVAVLIPSTKSDHFLIRPYTIFKKGSVRSKSSNPMPANK